MPGIPEIPFNSFFKQHDAIMLLTDGGTGQIIDVNDAALRFYGYNADQIKLMKIGDINKQLAEQLDSERNRAAQEDQKYFVVPHRLANGEMRTVEVHPSPILLDDKIFLFSVIHDITERTHAEEALREEKDKLSRIAATVPAMICSLHLFPDGSLHIPYASPVSLDLDGFRPEDLARDTSAILVRIHPDDLKSVNESIAESARTVSPWHHEFRYNHPQKGEIWIEGHSMPQYEADGSPVWHGILTDITERKQMEEKLRNIQKLESLGGMAAGIAHDFNNLLAIIFGYIDLVRTTSKETQTVEYMKATNNAMHRARALTLQLLTFAKGGAPIQKIIKLIPFIRETVQFPLSGSNILCKFYLAKNLRSCNIDKNQIAQVIDNMIINAQQAMPNGGTVKVMARNITIGENDHISLSKGKYVKVSIGDSGIGISVEVLPHIFDPFYTTKTKGHGLGLATCYSIIHRHGGCIEVDSIPGKGSTFHFYLPASSDPIAVRKTRTVKHKGYGTIIVMDDEESIRTMFKQILESVGYTVVCTKNGKEAINDYMNETKAKHEIAAMIFDLTVPGGMGGVEAVTEIRKRDKKIPVFAVSGYADDPVMRNPVQYGFTASISKPFSIAELMEMLNSSS